MEIQLQELIEQIKKDGVEAAETQAEAILKAAKAEAQKIVEDAKVQAEKMILDAKAENERVVKSSEDAICQAGRNLLISFREGVARELKVIVGENVNSVYSSDAFAKLIIHAVECWTGKPEAETVSVLLNQGDLEKLEEALLAAFKSRAVEGVTLKASDHFDGGFRVAINESGAYYDYSAEAVTDMLSNYLNPRVTALLKKAE